MAGSSQSQSRPRETIVKKRLELASTTENAHPPRDLPQKLSRMQFTICTHHTQTIGSAHSIQKHTCIQCRQVSRAIPGTRLLSTNQSGNVDQTESKLISVSLDENVPGKQIWKAQTHVVHPPDFPSQCFERHPALGQAGAAIEKLIERDTGNSFSDNVGILLLHPPKVFAKTQRPRRADPTRA